MWVVVLRLCVSVCLLEFGVMYCLSACECLCVCDILLSVCVCVGDILLSVCCVVCVYVLLFFCV